MIPKPVKQIIGIGCLLSIAVLVWKYNAKSASQNPEVNQTISEKSIERYSQGVANTHRITQVISKKSAVMKRKSEPINISGPDSTGNIFEAAIVDSEFTLQMELKLSNDSLPPIISVSGEYLKTITSRTDTLSVTKTRVIAEALPWYNTFTAGAAAVILCITILMVTK